MTDRLTIAVAQPTSVLHDVAANVHHHCELINRSTAAVMIFPELSLTGYGLDAPPVAPDDPRLQPLVTACRARNTTALVGAPIREDGGQRPKIAMLQVDENGVSVAYGKINLGDAEASVYRPGTEPAVVTVDGWRLGLAICKDTGVSGHASLTAELGMDIYVAGVCETDDDQAVTAERALRTIADHAVWVATASFAGPTGGGFVQTAGHSGVWRPDGSIVAELDETSGRFMDATLCW